MSKKTENEIRGKNFVLFAVACILIVSFGFGGFVLGVNYDDVEFFHKPDTKQDEKLNEKNVENEKKFELFNTTDDIVLNAYRNINIVNCTNKSFVSNKKITPTDVEQEVPEAVFLYLRRTLGNLESFTRDQVNDASNHLFGSQFSYPHGNYYGCPSNYIFHSEEGIYRREDVACGSTCHYSVMNRIVKAQSSGNSLEIYAKILFTDGDSYFNDYDKTNEVKLDYNYQDIPYETDDNYAKGGLYKFTYEKENDYYYFVSSEPVK